MKTKTQEKKLYWLVESNADLLMTVADLETCSHLINEDFSTLDEDEKKETEYTLTPVWYTDEEYEKLPEA